jgi:prephenate dehydrogenase
MTEFCFRRITVVGLGLIGGSWALALKKRGFQGTITGCDAPEVLDRAVAAGAIDASAEDVFDAVRDADLVLLAAPVGGILSLLMQIQHAVLPHALVTDVGSTKRLICERARDAFAHSPLFLGGHPLAGKEVSGFENADAALLSGARYALTPLTPDHLDDPRVQGFSKLLEYIGAKPFVCDAASHDRAMAYLSHLPQLMATSLGSLVGERRAEEFLPLELAGSGFRDVTRLAESPYAVWRDICLTNTENVQNALEALIEKLEALKLHLSDRELEREFGEANRLREQLRKLS